MILVQPSDQLLDFCRVLDYNIVESILQVRRHFKPELLNRLDEIVVFDPLSHEQLRAVARLQMKDVAKRLAERGIALAVTDAALDFVLAESYDPVSIHSPYIIKIYNLLFRNIETNIIINIVVIRCMVQGL